MPDTEIPLDVIEAMSLLRLHARKNKLPPNDNNFEDAANLLERQALQLADRASRAPDPSRDGLVEAVEAAWSQFINCRGDPSGDKAEDEAEEQRNVLALSAAIQALAPSVVAEPTGQTYYSEGKDADWFDALDDAEFAKRASYAAMDIADGDFSNVENCLPICAILSGAAERIRRLTTPSPHKGEPDVLRDAVAILKRLSILRIPPYELPADSFLEKAATEIITLVIAAPPPMEGMVPTHRHKKRGSEYMLVGIGKMQAERWLDGAGTEREVGNLISVDMREVAIYRSVEDGSLWVRPRKEFEDGRFEALAATPNHPEPGADHDRD